jgi:hypothetical protein
MTRPLRIALTLGLLGCATGCSTTVKYGLEDIRPTPGSEGRRQVKVAIAPFQDARPPEEKKPSIKLFNKAETRDSVFKNGDVVGGIRDAIARHFQQAQLFGETVPVGNEYTVPTRDVIQTMKNLGFDGSTRCLPGS